MPMSRRLLHLCLLVCLACGLAAAWASAARAQAQAQTIRIENTATLIFADAGVDRRIASNTVVLEANRAKRPTTLGFRLPPPGYVLDGMTCQTTPSPVFTPAPIDAATLAASPRVEAIDIYGDMILVLDNQAGNRDAERRESAVIQVDVGTRHTTLTLVETAVDAGEMHARLEKVQAELAKVQAELDAWRAEAERRPGLMLRSG